MGDDERPELPPEVEYPRPADDGTSTALPPKVESWRRRSATGAIMTGFALGLREVLEPERHEPAIVLETSGAPPKDLPVEADLDNVPPRRSVVKIRPWLLSGRAGDHGGTEPVPPPSGEPVPSPADDGAEHTEPDADGGAGPTGLG